MLVSDEVSRGNRLSLIAHVDRFLHDFRRFISGLQTKYEFKSDTWFRSIMIGVSWGLENHTLECLDDG